MAGGNRGKKTARGARPAASASQRQPQDIYASALDAFVTVFLDDCTFHWTLITIAVLAVLVLIMAAAWTVYKEIRAGVNEVTGEVENALHQVGRYCGGVSLLL